MTPAPAAAFLPLAGHETQALEAGVEPKYAAGLDHALEGLFCITRYRGHPGAEAAKQRCWELDLPGELDGPRLGDDLSRG